MLVVGFFVLFVGAGGDYDVGGRCGAFLACGNGLGDVGRCAAGRCDSFRLGDVTLAASKLVYLRNTGCLYYTSTTGSGTVCGSCCLTPRPDRLTAYEAGRPILTV